MWIIFRSAESVLQLDFLQSQTKPRLNDPLHFVSISFGLIPLTVSVLMSRLNNLSGRLLEVAHFIFKHHVICPSADIISDVKHAASHADDQKRFSLFSCFKGNSVFCWFIKGEIKQNQMLNQPSLLPICLQWTV